MYTVYMHITPSNKYYIGITKQSVNDRWKNGLGYSTQLHFWRAIIKYGWDNIQHIIVAENMSRKDACALERQLITTYKSKDPKFGYNCTDGGDGTCGFSHKNPKTKEWQDKIANANRGKKRSAESRYKMSIAKLGKHLSMETRKKISQAHKDGRLFVSEECRRKSEEARRISVALYENDIPIKYFKSLQECADSLGISISYVSTICNNKREPKKYDIRKVKKDG